MHYHGSASNEYFARSSVRSVGAQFGRMDNHFADFVGQGIGMNGNPFQFAYALAVSPTLAIPAELPIIGSSHTFYRNGKGNKDCKCICEELWKKK